MIKRIQKLHVLSILLLVMMCVNEFRAQNSSDPASMELQKFLESKPVPERMTTSWGAPVSTKTAVLTAGPRGPLLVQDFVFLDELSHFDRERMAERVVHAKGAGAFCHFEVTADITKYTRAVIFSQLGKKTPCFARFSTVGGFS